MKQPKMECLDCGKNVQANRREYVTTWESSMETQYDIEISKLYYECPCGKTWSIKVSKRV